MKINIWKIPFGWKLYKDGQFYINKEGYIESETFDKDDCWHLCNWSCWAEEKPKNLYSEIMACSSDVIFHDPVQDKYHLALSFGWHEADTLEDVINYLNR